MSSWIILLFLLLGNSNRGSGCGCQSGNRPQPGDNGCGCQSNNRPQPGDNDCGCNDLGFEPRFEAVPFGSRETCGCEESND